MVEETKKYSCDRQSIRLHKRGGRLCHGRIQKLGYGAKAYGKKAVCSYRSAAGTKRTPFFLEAHIDTLGAMVAEIKANGRLRVTAVGGMNAKQCRGRKL